MEPSPAVPIPSAAVERSRRERNGESLRENMPRDGRILPRFRRASLGLRRSDTARDVFDDLQHLPNIGSGYRNWRREPAPSCEGLRITGRARSHVCKNVLEITLSNARTTILADQHLLAKMATSDGARFPTPEMRAHPDTTFGKRYKYRRALRFLRSRMALVFLPQAANEKADADRDRHPPGEFLSLG